MRETPFRPRNKNTLQQQTRHNQSTTRCSIHLALRYSTKRTKQKTTPTEKAKEKKKRKGQLQPEKKEANKKQTGRRPFRVLLLAWQSIWPVLLHAVELCQRFVVHIGPRGKQRPAPRPVKLTHWPWPCDRTTNCVMCMCSYLHIAERSICIYIYICTYIYIYMHIDIYAYRYICI